MRCANVAHVVCRSFSTSRVESTLLSSKAKESQLAALACWIQKIPCHYLTSIVFAICTFHHCIP